MFDGKYPALDQKTKFCRVLVKDWKKSAAKHSIEKAILLNFVNLYLTFCPRLSEETDFYFWLGLSPLIWYLLLILLFEKTHLVFKLIFKATQLQKVPEYDIFPEILFNTLVSSMNLGLKPVLVAAAQCLKKIYFYRLKTDHLWCFNALLNKWKLKG